MRVPEKESMKQLATVPWFLDRPAVMTVSQFEAAWSDFERTDMTKENWIAAGKKAMSQ